MNKWGSRDCPAIQKYVNRTYLLLLVSIVFIMAGFFSMKPEKEEEAKVNGKSTPAFVVTMIGFSIAVLVSFIGLVLFLTSMYHGCNAITMLTSLFLMYL